jgi:hypothetical protein
VEAGAESFVSKGKPRLLGRSFMLDQKNINHVAEKLLDRRKLLPDRIRTGNIVAAEELEMKS